MAADPLPASSSRSRSGVQSLDRAFAILEAMADAGGVIGLSQLAAEAKLPLATIHRLVRTLVDLGYVRQEPSRQYSLGPRLMRLAESSTKRLRRCRSPYMTGSSMRSASRSTWRCSTATRSSTSRKSSRRTNFMRMFTEVGRRDHAALPPRSAKRSSPTARRTMCAPCSSAPGCRAAPSTRSPPRRCSSPTSSAPVSAGYALDDGEQELGVRCVGLVVPGAPRPLALSLCPGRSRGCPMTSSRAPLRGCGEHRPALAAEPGGPSRLTAPARSAPDPVRVQAASGAP